MRASASATASSAMSSAARVLLHLVDATSEHAGKDYRIVRAELEAYGHGLAEKPEIVALSKCDAADPDHLKQAKAAPEARLRPHAAHRLISRAARS